MNTPTQAPAHDSRHTPGPHPVAVADPAQWLRTFAMQYKGETRASLELCARRSDAAPELLEALKEAVSFIGLKHGWNDQSYQTTDGRVIWFCADKARQAIAKAEGRT